jgi:hypothetical protein
MRDFHGQRIIDLECCRENNSGKEMKSREKRDLISLEV